MQEDKMFSLHLITECMKTLCLQWRNQVRETKHGRSTVSYVYMLTATYYK